MFNSALKVQVQETVIVQETNSFTCINNAYKWTVEVYF